MINKTCSPRASLLPGRRTASRGRNLPRRASLGLSMPTANQAGSAAVVDQLVPGQTAAALGVLRATSSLKRAGAPRRSPAVIAYAGTLRAGDPVELKVRRAGKEIRLRGKAIGRALESYKGAKVDYGAVPFRGGHLRDIMVTPPGAAEPPVLFLLQGFSCASIEPPTPSHPYRRLAEELSARGIAYYRVEKPGMGDSAGTPACRHRLCCRTGGLPERLQALVNVRGVSPDRIFMLGHSLAAFKHQCLQRSCRPAEWQLMVRSCANVGRLPPRRRYLPILPLLRRRSGTLSCDRRGEQRNFSTYYFGREAPSAIAAATQHMARRCAGFSAGTGETVCSAVITSSCRIWRTSRSSPHGATPEQRAGLYGESDVVAVFDTDHRLLADIANWHRPGAAATSRWPEPIMPWGRSATIRASRKDDCGRTGADRRVQPEIAEFSPAGSREAMSKPPVRTLAHPRSTAPAGGTE
jgi:hypothetical protein